MTATGQRTPGPAGKRSPRNSRSRRAAWLTPKRLLTAAAIAVALIGVPLLRRCLPDLADRPEYQVTADDITITPVPKWVPQDIVRDAMERAGFEESVSLLDDALSERLAAAFHTHPWIAGVRSVKKSFPTRVHVEVRYRRPVALVEGVDGYYPIDERSVLLPADGFTPAAVAAYPLIVGVASVPMGAIGEEWGDPAVRGAAELAAVLLREGPGGSRWWDALQLRAIAVPGRVALGQSADELEFVLMTEGGSRIHWGRSPASQHPGELSIRQKLDRLSEYHAGFGGFDDAHGPWDIDIRPWHGIARSRLSAADRPQVRRQ